MNFLSLQVKTHVVPPRPIGRAARAFTLLEVTVALVIVAMLAAALWASLVVAFKARDSAIRQLSGVRQTRVALDRVARDLQQAIPPTGVLAGAFIATPRENGEDVDSLTFYAVSSRSISGAAVGRGDLQQVTFTVLPESQVLAAVVDEPAEEDPQAGPRLAPRETGEDAIVLVRRVNGQLLSPVEAQPPYEILARHVRMFTLSYYDGEQWVESWDSTTMDNQLPAAVEITLQIALMGDATASPDTPVTTQTARTYTMKRIVRPTCHGWTPPDTSATGGGASGSGRPGGSGGQDGGGRAQR